MKFEIDSRLPEDQDDVKVSITRGLLRQLIRDATSQRMLEFAFLPENACVTGIAVLENYIQFSLENGEIIEADFWPDRLSDPT